MPYCTSCGQLLKDGANFCTSCGAKQSNGGAVQGESKKGGLFSKMFSSSKEQKPAKPTKLSRLESLIIEADKKTPGANEQLWAEMDRLHIDEDYDPIRRALYRRLAQQGDPFAEVQLADIEMTEDRPQEAYALYYSAAQKGFAPAMAGIGNLYNETFNEMYKGLGYDPEKTFYWYMEAAKRNDPEGIYYIAQYYRDGVCVPASYEAAKSWAERGDQLSFPKCTKFLADWIYNNPESPYNDDYRAIQYWERTIRMGEESQYAWAALALGRKFGAYYLYGGDQASYSNPLKAAYCLVLAFIADDLSSWEEIEKIPYRISESEFNAWKDDAIHRRYRG